MSAAKTLDEAWHEFAAESIPRDASTLHRVQLRRAWMAAVDTCLTLQAKGVKPAELRAELLQYGRAVGTAAESAS